MLVTNAVVEYAIYQGVDDYVAKLEQEDPDIMGPKTESSKVMMNPALLP